MKLFATATNIGETRLAGHSLGDDWAPESTGQATFQVLLMLGKVGNGPVPDVEPSGGLRGP